MPINTNNTKKAVLITGAGSGIGAATAIEFSRQGYFVYLLGRNREKLQNTALQCRQGASIIACDLKDPVQVIKKINEVLAVQIHEVEVLVNNAGIFAKHSTADGSDDLWLEQFQVNLLGALRVTRLMIPYFLRLGRGSIVNVSSTLGLKPTSDTSAYSATKAAMINWTQSLAQELGSQNIRANAICPGIVETPIHGGMDMKTIGHIQPLGRVGQPEEIAKSIYFLASPDSAWTTGAVLSVDGGIHLA